MTNLETREPVGRGPHIDTAATASRRRKTRLLVAGTVAAATVATTVLVATYRNNQDDDQVTTDRILSESIPSTNPSRAATEPAPSATSTVASGSQALREEPARPSGPVEDSGPATVGPDRPGRPARVDPSKITVVRTGRTGDMLAVYSSPQDLSGYHALNWVRNGKRHGSASCSQTITTSPETPARKRPNLLICWRTSRERSVYTITVDFDGHPSRPKSLSALKKAWRKIG